MMWKIVLPVLAVGFSVGVAGLIGGFQDIDVNDEGALNALNFSVSNHNRRSNDIFLSQPAEVIKVQRQVVAGYKYVITVRMAKTPCRKNATEDVCDIHEDPARAQPYQCIFTVWSRPWLNDTRVLKEEC
ncbi:cystatin C (amyloid angiopathy and cerebral hemorrhage) [Clinocottus analis]|uniref:cystatin C (amyloid angiopathy and cerebral hemorrhage) n=1 Tax=Clinocottus analis TaxID=304258 RepID=UPI0035C05B3A